jgi:hypothetical protein
MHWIKASDFRDGLIFAPRSSEAIKNKTTNQMGTARSDPQMAFGGKSLHATARVA